ncbi:RHS repeat-associated core domain-containing protein [Apibacter muscae]|uniref:RHS repeat-associated core domain-containing protein n=1 Tax=Apibacter muscae TaxID=2509004 RepID=UPI0021D003D9|nr:RHS repeat-associated core domain-containing protein [Apibacter muscae]
MKQVLPFRQLGQYEDIETGLYYNRFRYYNPETGMYISQDPIGIEGNNPNLYAYTHDSNTMVDPFGLDEKETLELLFDDYNQAMYGNKGKKMGHLIGY